MTPTKPWYLSKTVWFNVITFLIGLVGFLTNNKLITNPEAIAIFTAFTTIGNLVLRAFFTSTAIGPGTPTS